MTVGLEALGAVVADLRGGGVGGGELGEDLLEAGELSFELVVAVVVDLRRGAPVVELIVQGDAGAEFIDALFRLGECHGCALVEIGWGDKSTRCCRRGKISHSSMRRQAGHLM